MWHLSFLSPNLVGELLALWVKCQLEYHLFSELFAYWITLISEVRVFWGCGFVLLGVVCLFVLTDVFKSRQNFRSFVNEGHCYFVTLSSSGSEKEYNIKFEIIGVWNIETHLFQLLNYF